jgi:16S rRNA (guanine966-N2)-methyltransferase
LFSTIESLVRYLPGPRVQHQKAGSGAVGLEALSRGADHVLLVESDPRAARTIRDNAADIGLTGAVVRADRVERVVAGPGPATAYDVAFLDPPYTLADDQVRAVLGSLVTNGWLRPGALVVVERATRDDEWRWPDGVTGDRSRRYGEATLWYGRAAGPGKIDQDRPEQDIIDATGLHRQE